jgi:hypothetical protein
MRLGYSKRRPGGKGARLNWIVFRLPDSIEPHALLLYFGVTEYNDSVPDSIAPAKPLGGLGGAAVREPLAEPFILYTSFA